MHFEGIGGSIAVSIVAFSIVFGVLLVLTATIYAMRLFSRSEDGGKGGTAPDKAAPAKAAPAPAAAPAKAVAVSQPNKVVAAITAAILAATGGRGRILSIRPASAGVSAPFSNWRASGITGLVTSRLTRTWKQ